MDKAATSHTVENVNSFSVNESTNGFQHQISHPFWPISNVLFDTTMHAFTYLFTLSTTYTLPYSEYTILFLYLFQGCNQQIFPLSINHLVHKMSSIDRKLMQIFQYVLKYLRQIIFYRLTVQNKKIMIKELRHAALILSLILVIPNRFKFH